MMLWTRLVLCAWLTACGSGPAPPPAPEPAPAPGSGAPSVPVRLPAITPRPTPSPCLNPVQGRSAGNALLRIGCEGDLEPGRATWTVTGNTVVLEFLPGSTGPRGAELVAAWPPRDRPPWLGHRIDRVAVIADGGIRVEFGDPARDPARLFADPRLAGVPLRVEDGDVRDAIDADAGEVVTRHDESIEYARSIGRNVEPVGFDRLYLVAFAGSTGDNDAEVLANEVGIDWIGRGAALARRLPSLRWDPVAEMCTSVRASAAGDSLIAPVADEPTSPPSPTVSYPEDDPASRQIAERLVSLGLPGGPLAATVAQLTGSRERMVVRPVAAGGDRWNPTDVAAVIAGPGGPVHPCSLYAEVMDGLTGFDGSPEPALPTVLPIGESASFAIEPSSGRRP